MSSPSSSQEGPDEAMLPEESPTRPRPDPGTKFRPPSLAVGQVRKDVRSPRSRKSITTGARHMFPVSPKLSGCKSLLRERTRNAKHQPLRTHRDGDLIKIMRMPHKIPMCTKTGIHKHTAGACSKLARTIWAQIPPWRYRITPPQL